MWTKPSGCSISPSARFEFECNQDSDSATSEPIGFRIWRFARMVSFSRRDPPGLQCLVASRSRVSASRRPFGAWFHEGLRRGAFRGVFTGRCNNGTDGIWTGEAVRFWTMACLYLPIFLGRRNGHRAYAERCRAIVRLVCMANDYCLLSRPQKIVQIHCSTVPKGELKDWRV
jgi:hypothetical protein